MAVPKKSPGSETGRQEEREGGREGVHYTLLNELPVRHLEKLCHANASQRGAAPSSCTPVDSEGESSGSLPERHPVNFSKSEASGGFELILLTGSK